MPDLHSWIGQQIARAETNARAAEKEDGRDWTAQWDERSDAFQIRDGIGILVADQLQPCAAGLITTHDPATVLRRCAADRKILARHCRYPDRVDDRLFATACHGCGVMGDCDDPVTENLNDCPELLDLAYAHGLTEEILASLDRPEPPPGPEYPGKTGNIVVDSVVSMYAQMLAAVDETITRTLVDGDGTGAPLGLRIVDGPREEPTALDRALALLDPELRACPLYRPKFAAGGFIPNGIAATADRPPARRACNWIAHPAPLEG